MPSPKLILVLLFVACFSLSAAIEQWWVRWEGNRAEESLLEVTLGDGRKLFARHFYFKADSYFHSGFYPSIFDAPLDEGRGEEAAPAKEVSAERKADQAAVDGAIKISDADLKLYLSKKFYLTKGQYPHTMKF